MWMVSTGTGSSVVRGNEQGILLMSSSSGSASVYAQGPHRIEGVT